MGKPIIMGRKTFESIGKPLPGRLNIVLSSAPKTQVGVEWVESLPQALALAGEAPEVMIIGGATLFQQSLVLAGRIYLTLIHGRFAADVFFPQLQPEEWHCSAMQEYPRDEKNAYDLSFYQYDRRAKGSSKIK
jgi:dihydrofolate reductase